MGLFDKKKGSDPSTPEASDPFAPAKLSAQNSVVTSAQALGAAQRAAAVPDQAGYGIRQAIELMRGLPPENVNLVVQVVKRTLESAQIRIDTIIEDASRRQAEIESRIAVLQNDIAELDQEITLRKEEIATLTADCQETIRVRERLMLAERLSHSPEPVARIVASSPPPERAAPVVPERAERADRTDRTSLERAPTEQHRVIDTPIPEARPRTSVPPISRSFPTVPAPPKKA